VASYIRTRDYRVSVLDIGAGGASYWLKGPLADLLHTGKISLTILDPVEKRPHLSKYQVGWISETAQEGLVKMNEGHFDVVLAFDVIEHLPKHDGYKMLYQMDRVSSQEAFLFTPNGFIWQPPGLNNPFNAHVSKWTLSEFRQMRCLKVQAVGPWKVLIGPNGLPKKIVCSGFTRLLIEISTFFQAITPRWQYGVLVTLGDFKKFRKAVYQEGLY